ncbi:hypothetical protein Esi_0132_0085 [Ectocarpus siliculosus]|uniref:Uncharacterized protein n=1 Tax=Ectocarpus siliculosus TaxID=2880 RepID=D8LEN5_ECTSI|nr:hypothetical protein Esi_0132_0085 [Ectocarpus siliculosus]|eukprot:CBN78598.1 hypothetical protein Esi_0132_0085 [Ectocarpus siliculosus]
MSKQEDPIDDELLPDASQTAKELLAKGLFKDKFTAALLNGIEPDDGDLDRRSSCNDGCNSLLLARDAAFALLVARLHERPQALLVIIC